MAPTQLVPVLPHLRRLIAVQQAEGVSDHQLLQDFTLKRDSQAFTAIVERHGKLVFGVCRRVLQHLQDAEDAFQATFLVLSRRAGSIRKRESLASWLYGVAYRMSMKAKRDAARRRTHEKLAGVRPVGNGAHELTWRDAQAILDDEIRRLPDKYRAPFLLCCLESQSRTEAAAQLGLKEGTLSSRLAFARQRLQMRLTRRGVTLAALLSAAMLATAPVSAALVLRTAQSAAVFAAGHATAGILSAKASILAQGALRAMLIARMKIGVLFLVASGLLIGWTGSSIGHVTDGAGTGAAVEATDDEAAEAAIDEEPARAIFRDVTAESGVNFTYRNGEEAGHCTVLESLGGGVGILDFDGDGLPDIFVTGGGYFAGADKPEIRGYPCKLYKNLGNGKFKDVTKEAGLDGLSFYTHGVAVADYDCDGWPDLLATGWGRLALYRNVSDGKGGRKFVDVTARAGLPAGLWTTSAAFADLDGDGFPDLFVCQYMDWSFDNHPWRGIRGVRQIAPPKVFNGLPHKLFRNNGDGTFTDVSAQAGIRQPGAKEGDAGKGLGVVIADLDGDGRPDIFVANDTVDNHLYHNKSRQGKFQFEEMGLQAGIARDDIGNANGSRGIAIGDYDSSGRPSLLVTAYENERIALYRNLKANSLLFHFSSSPAGLASIPQTRVSWGAAFLDFDGDGALDFFTASGHIYAWGTAKRGQRPLLMRNLGNGKFLDVTAQGGPYFLSEHNARGVATVDLDNDGRIALIISHINEPVVILRNQSAPAQHHWIGFELVGKKRRDVVGAKVIVETDARTQASFAHGGGSYASSSDRRHLFGLGNSEKVRRISVMWPGGDVQHWDGLAVDRYWRLTEGEGAEEARPRR